MAEIVPPGLIEAHKKRLRLLDPLLSVDTALSAYQADDDSAVLLHVPGAVGLARRDTVSARDIASLYGALTRYQLQTVWDGSAKSLDLLISRWAQWVGTHRPRSMDPETEASIRMPARDTTAARVLLAHGLAPAATVAIRPAGRVAGGGVCPDLAAGPTAGWGGSSTVAAGPTAGGGASSTVAAGPMPGDGPTSRAPTGPMDGDGPTSTVEAGSRAVGGPSFDLGAGSRAGPPGVTIRRAHIDDIGAILDLAAEEMEYESGLSQLVARPNQRTLMRPEVLESLSVDKPWTWIATEAGRPVGALRLSNPEAARWIVPVSGRQPAAYLGLLSVTASARGRGIGAALVLRAHTEADSAGMAAIVLHYGTFNPLSVPFWSRMGYRPLWSIWQVSPVDYLR